MEEITKKLIGQREKDDALLNFASRQAQESILNPNLPESYKDEVLGAAIATIHKVGGRKAAYFAKHGEGRSTRQPK